MTSLALLAVCDSSLTSLEVTGKRQRPRCCWLLIPLSGLGQEGSLVGVPHFFPVQARGSDWHRRPQSPPCSEVGLEGRFPNPGVWILEGT